MESNENTEVEPTVEEWKARALKAELGLYNIDYQMCEGADYVYGDSGDHIDDLENLGDAIWEAAGFDLDTVPTPPCVTRRQTDRRPICQDRVLYAVYNSWRVSEGAILAVGRSDDSESVMVLLRNRWDALNRGRAERGEPTSARCLRCSIVNLHAGQPMSVPGWTEDELRTVLLEGDPSHEPRLVEDRLKLGA